MEFKSIDTLSITECCEQLNLRREDLPEALQEVIEPSERDQLLIEQLQSLLDEDKLAIESCRTIEQYEGYLSTWVDGLYHSHARTRIAQLKAAAEELAFYQENKDSISGCEAYLQRYPKGKFVSDAQSTLAQKKKARKTRNIILLVLLLIAAGIFAYCNYVPVSYVNVDDNAELNNLGSEISLGISTDAISSTITATSSEDWIDCRVSGKTLYISANTNPKGERSATITITAHSSFFGSELSDRKQETITVSQKTGYASHLSVSNDDVYLTANGGRSSISINTDGIFAVSTVPASWVSTSVNGKTLNLECGVNSGIARNTYLIIQSGAKTLRLNIAQAGKSATRLDVSTSNIELNADGGNRTIDIYTDGECQISTQPASWANATISGNSISLRVNENPGTKRSDYFVIKSGSYEKRINISQAGKTATHLNVSSDNISYSYSGGTRTITVSTDGEWQISTGTAEWGHTSISGNTITLRIDENTSSSSRTDYFVIKSGSKEKRINISQDGKPATRLSVSTENVSFGKDGGRRTITVSTNGEWRIGVGTASWAHTSISGNTITLRVDENNSGDERTDYFTVVAGDKDVRIDISQEGGPSAEINRIRQKHNVINGYSKGMQIEVEFDVSNMKGKRVTATALFYYGDNTTPLNSAWGGQVSISKSDTAPYTNTTFTMNLFIPYQNLNMAPGWSGNLSFDIVIKDSNGKKLARENNQSFTYSQGAWFY